MNVEDSSSSKTQQIVGLSLVNESQVPKNKARRFLLRHLSQIYSSEPLHCSVIEFLLNCLIDRKGFDLNAELTSQFPLHKFKKNYLFILQMHLKSPDNQKVCVTLHDQLKEKINHIKQKKASLKLLSEANSLEKGIFASSHRELLQRWNRLDSIKILLKLLSPHLSQLGRKYVFKSKFSSGAYSTVHHLETGVNPGTHPRRVAKLVQVSSNQHDRNSAFFLFSEIKILKMILRNNNFRKGKRLPNRRGQLLELFDFGLCQEKNAYFLVFPELEYLQQRTRGSSGSLTVTNRYKFFTDGDSGPEQMHSTLRILHKLIQDIRHLHLSGITHFDIKADNIMYKTDALGRKVPLLIDFGESLFGGNGERLRGTEYMKSPEMLINKLNSGQSEVDGSPFEDGRKR